jgi:hypothetical protein
MGRPKGSGAIKQIDPAKQDFVGIRNLLHAGRNSVRDEHADLFFRWRGAVALRDDCAKRVKSGEGTKWTRKRLKQLEREVDEKWRELGATLGGMSDEQLSRQLAVLSEAARPSVYGWQQEATRLVEAAVLLDRSTGRSKTMQPQGKTVNLTSSKLHEQMSAEGFNVTMHDLRQFVRDVLKVTLLSERGKRG